ncbi:MFS transporter [Acidicapsa acidisoli]|uniref:MFS transporter n=1 Tax=Acidicapsa acidisoli TaxID=1615681 RepID=UPI0021DFAB90|nr:MFS transporter [Acidicapsa acidisoli]
MATLPLTRSANPSRRWRIAWLLGLGVLVNYFDRVNLSVSQAALYTTFGISSVTFGYLSGAYNWTYAMCQLPIGVILDKFGIRRVGRVSTFLWSIASFAAAISPSVGGLFGARLLLGVGEAPTFPANAKAIGRWFPPQERSFATSLFDSAAKFSSAIGVPVIGLLLLRIGWRWSFAVTGLISFLYFLLFSRIYRDPQDDPELTEAELDYIEHGSITLEQGVAALATHQKPAVEDPPVPLWTLMRQPKVLGMVLGFGSYNYVFYLLLTWLPGYLSIQLHLDLMHSFLYTGFPWLVATFADLCIGGLLADALIQRGWNSSRVRKTILVGGTACGLGILGAANVHSPLPALLWISLSIGGLSAASAIGWSIPSLITPRNSVGSVGGIINFSNQISGISAPIVTGYLVQSMHSFAWAFGVSAIYLVIGITAYLVLLGRIEPMFPESL